MADAIELYLDISTPQGKLVKGLSDGTTFPFGPFYQGATLKLRVYPIITTGSAVTAPYYRLVDLTSLELQVAVGQAPGPEALEAYQGGWSKQTTDDGEETHSGDEAGINSELGRVLNQGYFYADLNLNTTELNAAIGTLTSYLTTVEFLLSRNSGVFAAVHQAALTLRAAVKGPTGAAVLPGTVIPAGAEYNGSGDYALAPPYITYGIYYQWADGGANDTSYTNGGGAPQTTDYVAFLATNPVVLQGVGGADVTALVRLAPAWAGVGASAFGGTAVPEGTQDAPQYSSYAQVDGNGTLVRVWYRTIGAGLINTGWV